MKYKEANRGYSKGIAVLYVRHVLQSYDVTWSEFIAHKIRSGSPQECLDRSTQDKIDLPCNICKLSDG